MTSKTAANLLAASHWLSAHPDLPEPLSVSCWPNMSPSVMWREDEETARRVIAAIGGDWSTDTYPVRPRTIAASRPLFGDVAISVMVVVEDALVPDLAIAAGMSELPERVGA